MQYVVFESLNQVKMYLESLNKTANGTITYTFTDVATGESKLIPYLAFNGGKCHLYNANESDKMSNLVWKVEAGEDALEKFSFEITEEDLKYGIFTAYTQDNQLVLDNCTDKLKKHIVLRW